METTAYIYDGRELNLFVPSHVDDFPLTIEAYRVYSHLVRKSGKDHRKAWPSYQNIGEHCFRASYPNSSQASLKKKAIDAVKELIYYGLIRKESINEGGEYNHNVYHLTSAKEWDSSIPFVESCNIRKGRPGQKRKKTAVNPDNPPVNGDNHPPVNGDNPNRLMGITESVNGDNHPGYPGVPKGNPSKVIQEGNPNKVIQGGSDSFFQIGSVSYKTHPREIDLEEKWAIDQFGAEAEARSLAPGHKYPKLVCHGLGELWHGPKRNDWNPQYMAAIAAHLEKCNYPSERGNILTWINKRVQAEVWPELEIYLESCGNTVNGDRSAPLSTDQQINAELTRLHLPGVLPKEFKQSHGCSKTFPSDLNDSEKKAFLTWLKSCEVAA